ncbi:MAG: glycosyltransferase family 2 protein [Candidatus Hodarchaeota archaeon]
MRISIVIPIFEKRRLTYLKTSLKSFARQTYKNIEVIIIVEKDKIIYKKLKDYLSSLDLKHKILFQERVTSLSSARNRGIDAASGDIIAFLDDDAIPFRDWAERVAETYSNLNPAGVTGKIIPSWIGKRPSFLSEELYWLIGATYKGFPEKLCRVDWGLGANISFRREVFERIGRFSEELGFSGSRKIPIGGEEVEFCLRLVKDRGKIIYNPDAKVLHKIDPAKLALKRLLLRSFWYGRGRKLIESRIKTGHRYERSYLRVLLNFYIEDPTSLPHRKFTSLKRIIFTTAVLILVMLGYFYSILRPMTD